MGFDGLYGGGIDIGITQSIRIGSEPFGERMSGRFGRCPGARCQTPEAESRQSGEDITTRDHVGHGALHHFGPIGF
jgi:hypothetical protein